tara:strand:+ start:1393 stop:2022 length:630 start_codon:yes stop_codon:yes gene_type:complete
MLLQNWLYLSLICFLGACSPGPSVLIVLGLVFSEGKKAGISASIGHGFGVFCYAFLCAIGLGYLIEIYVVFFTIIKFFGALFLLYLALMIIRSSLIKQKYKQSQKYLNTTIKKNRFIEGFVVAIFNPKIAVFFLSLFSQFLSSDQTYITHFFMAIIAGGIDTLVYCIIVLLASRRHTASFFGNYGTKISIIFGILLIFLSLSLFVSLLI